MQKPNKDHKINNPVKKHELHNKAVVKENVLLIKKTFPFITILRKGEILNIYTGPTYGIITVNSLAVTRDISKPFFQVPENILRII